MWKVINYSGGHIWNGAGNGTDRDGNEIRTSLLAAVDYATSNGVSWVNASGNAGAGTFFKRNPVFHATGHYLQFDPFGLSFGCSSLSVGADDAGEDYFFQLRSDGNWSRADTNLAIALDGPLKPSQGERRLYISTEMQSGEDGARSF